MVHGHWTSLFPPFHAGRIRTSLSERIKNVPPSALPPVRALKGLHIILDAFRYSSSRKLHRKIRKTSTTMSDNNKCQQTAAALPSPFPTAHSAHSRSPDHSQITAHSTVSTVRTVLLLFWQRPGSGPLSLSLSPPPLRGSWREWSVSPGWS